ncbi:acetyltransferase [Limibacter armeniacum]|uniref:acetyltransferase n=1 Tax=Limibacter armeniacum TaxID=466084 RepID=UPI002FE65753
MTINPVIIFGATGLGKTALEIFKSQDVLVYCFLDEDSELHGSEVAEVGVLGDINDDGFLKYIGKKCDAFVAIDNNKQRRSIVKMLNDRRKVMPVNAIHKDASVAQSAFLGYGNMVNAQAVVGADAKVPNHCIINAGAIVEHSVEMGDFVQIGAGAVVGARVQIGEEALIGSGSTITPGIKIGKGAQVAPGSLVMQDVPEGATVFGVPAKQI